MTISVEILLLGTTIVSVIIAYILMRLQIAQKLQKEAEERGRMMQRIDVLEQTLDKIEKRHTITDDRIGKHDSDIASVCKELEGLHATVGRIESKLDKVLEQRNRYED